MHQSCESSTPSRRPLHSPEQHGRLVEILSGRTSPLDRDTPLSGHLQPSAGPGGGSTFPALPPPASQAQAQVQSSGVSRRQRASSMAQNLPSSGSRPPLLSYTTAESHHGSSASSTPTVVSMPALSRPSSFVLGRTGPQPVNSTGSSLNKKDSSADSLTTYPIVGAAATMPTPPGRSLTDTFQHGSNSGDRCGGEGQILQFSPPKGEQPSDAQGKADAPGGSLNPPHKARLPLLLFLSTVAVLVFGATSINSTTLGTNADSSPSGGAEPDTHLRIAVGHSVQTLDKGESRKPSKPRERRGRVQMKGGVADEATQESEFTGFPRKRPSKHHGESSPQAGEDMDTLQILTSNPRGAPDSQITSNPIEAAEAVVARVRARPVAGPTTAPKSDPDFPLPSTTTHIVFMGDSVTRYQYLDLVYAVHFNGAELPEQFASERNGWKDWTEFFRASTELFGGAMICDCYRHPILSCAEPKACVENRYYKHPSAPLTISHLQLFGDTPMNGRVHLGALPYHRPGGTMEGTVRLAYVGNLTEILLREVAGMSPTPTHIVMNAGYWPHGKMTVKFREFITAVESMNPRNPPKLIWKETNTRQSVTENDILRWRRSSSEAMLDRTIVRKALCALPHGPTPQIYGIPPGYSTYRNAAVANPQMGSSTSFFVSTSLWNELTLAPAPNDGESQTGPRKQRLANRGLFPTKKPECYFFPFPWGSTVRSSGEYMDPIHVRLTVSRAWNKQLWIYMLNTIAGDWTATR